MPQPDPRLIAAEMLAQQDMQERGRRLSAFRAKTEGKVWRHVTRTGEWVLESVVDGTLTKIAAVALIAACHSSPTAPKTPPDCTVHYWDPITVFYPDGTSSTITFPMPKPPSCPASNHLRQTGIER